MNWKIVLFSSDTFGYSHQCDLNQSWNRKPLLAKCHETLLNIFRQQTSFKTRPRMLSFQKKLNCLVCSKLSGAQRKIYEECQRRSSFHQVSKHHLLSNFRFNLDEIIWWVKAESDRREICRLDIPKMQRIISLSPDNHNTTTSYENALFILISFQIELCAPLQIISGFFS